MSEKLFRVAVTTPSLSLPRFAGEGTLTIRIGGFCVASGVCSLSREAGEGWGGGLS